MPIVSAHCSLVGFEPAPFWLSALSLNPLTTTLGCLPKQNSQAMMIQCLQGGWKGNTSFAKASYLQTKEPKPYDIPGQAV